MRVGGILETALYVADVRRAAEFYRRLFGFDTLLESERLIALDVAGRNVLLLFMRGATVEPFEVPGGVIPPHDGSGPTHFAFSIASEDVEAWRNRLESEGTPVESVVNWPGGATSLYFRDPDGHLAELITPGFWSFGRKEQEKETPGGVFFRAVGSIGDTDTNALPVREVGPAIGYYTRCLGFTLVERDKSTARLRRDAVEIGLAVNGANPEHASCWFSVGDVDALHREYEAKGVSPGIIDEQEFGGNRFRVFFAKEPFGVCFCFTHPLDPS